MMTMKVLRLSASPLLAQGTRRMCAAAAAAPSEVASEAFDAAEAFRRRGEAMNPPASMPVPGEVLDEYFNNPHLKRRSVPIQLRQSGDLGGDGMEAPGSRMLIDARTRKGPFFHLSQRAGAWAFTHYNVSQNQSRATIDSKSDTCRTSTPIMGHCAWARGFCTSRCRLSVY